MKRAYFVTATVPLLVFAGSYHLGLGVPPSSLLAVLSLLVTGSAAIPGAWQSLYWRTGVGPVAWLLAAVVATGGIALSYVVGNPQPFCDSGFHRGCLTPYGYASAIFLGSSLAVAIVAGHADRYHRLRTTSVVPADEASEGLVAVEGRVVAADATVQGPVSREETVWYRHIVEQKSPFRIRRERDRTTGGGAFFVADSSGRLLVRPDNFDDHDVAELARSHTDVAGERSNEEWSYQPGDAVTVVGRASVASHSEYPERLLVGNSEPVLVGIGSKRDLRGWAAQRVVTGGILTLTVGGGSLLVLLLTA